MSARRYPAPPKTRHPGALAGAAGAASTLPSVESKDTQKSFRTATCGVSGNRVAATRGRITDTGRAIARAVALLHAADEAGNATPGELAAGLATILRRRLGPAERLLVANAATLSLNRDAAERLAGAMLEDARRGAPIPPLDDIEGEAATWAAWAAPAERRAYVAAIWRHLLPSERRAFLEAGRSAAA